jgi:hypothetical protein
MQPEQNTLQIRNPYGKWRHRGQVEYLDSARARRQVHLDTDGKCGIQKLNYCGGRGAGKTTIGIIDMVNVAMVEAPDFRTFWSEPNFSDIDRILLPEMEKIVPSSIWRVVNKPGGYRYIEWASGHRTDLISRFVGNSNKRPGLGANMIGGWHDELASGFDENKTNDIENSIVASQSTPLRNGYESYCKDPAATTVYATSWDNPHISADVLNSRAATMSPEQVEQELKGRFTSLEGLIWKHFIDKPWPLGNIVEGVKFQKGQPWYLSCDLGGSQSAYQVYQLIEAINPINGRREMDGKLFCCVEEWTPNQMSFETVLKEVIERYCDGDPQNNKPTRVFIGHDVNTKDSITGTSAALILSHLRWDWTYPAGKLSSKDLQRSHALTMLFSKRWVVAANKDRDGEYQIAKQHYGERKRRGILNCLRTDTYPDAKSKDVFNKDKGQAGKNAVEDDRDCFLYANILWRHPDIFDTSFYKR